jgi:predicted ribosome quality control (RQC) complex YloA/Tae2 family protein
LNGEQKGTVRVQLSSFDVERLAAELSDQVRGSRVQNAYLLPDGSYTLRLRKGSESWELQLVPESLVVLVKGTFEERAEPDGFCRALREHLRGKTVTAIEAVKGERAVSIRFEGGLELCCQLYPGGRIALLNATDGSVLAAHPAQKHGETSIGPCKGSSATLDLNALEGLRKTAPSKKLGSVLVRELGIAPKYANEALHRAGLQGDLRIGELGTDQLERLRREMEALLEEARSGTPRIYVLKDRAELSLVRLTHLEDEAVEVKEFGEVNEAVREYHRMASALQSRSARLKEVEERARRLEREAEEKLAQAASIGAQAEGLRRAAEALFVNAGELERLRLTRSGALVSEGLRAEVRGNAIEVEVGGQRFQLSLGEPVTRQISSLFDRVKGLEEARRNLVAEAERLRSDAERIRHEAEKLEAPKAVSVRPSKPKQWYESYRWTFTTSGRLVVGGKDASSNVRLLKRHTEREDLVFHAEVRGSPVVLLKGGASDESDVIQAATFCAAYSRAWREGLGSVSVYYVRPEQISFTPPPGMYLEKGSFIVKPPKNYVAAELKIAIGVTAEGEAVCGHPDYVRTVSVAYAVIRPGRRHARELVGELVREVERVTGSKPDERLVERLMSLVPYGVGELVELRVLQSKADVGNAGG